MPDLPTTPPAAPGVPPKPFKISRWILGAFILFAALYIAISLIRIDMFSGKREAAEARLPSAPASQSLLDTFDKGRQQKIAEIKRKRDLMLAELQKAGLGNEEDLLEIVGQLPPCDDAERIRLSGQNYVAANQKTRQVIQFTCGLDDTWHPLPLEATTIEPPTARQARAMHAGGTVSNTSAKEKAAAALDAALRSNSVVDYAEPTVSTPVGSETTGGIKTVPVAEHGGAADSNGQTQTYPWNSSTGKLFEVFEGKLIEGILANRLAGEFTGPVDVMVTTNFYSIDHQHVLIPQGARILGKASNVSVAGQRRLAVIFHRIIMQDGYSLDLNGFAGLDHQGAAGLTGRVDTHWPSLIATAVLVGAISGLSESYALGTGGGIGYIGFGVGQQTGQAATQILDRALNRLPTVTVYEGTRVRIWVQRDFKLPDIDNHTVIPNV